MKRKVTLWFLKSENVIGIMLLKFPLLPAPCLNDVVSQDPDKPLPLYTQGLFISRRTWKMDEDRLPNLKCYFGKAGSICLDLDKSQWSTGTFDWQKL